MKTLILFLALSSMALAQKNGQLGAQLSGIPGGGRGAVVTTIVPGSPAAQAGLMPGDVLIGVGSTLVEGPHHAAERLALYPPGDQALLSLVRAGRVVSLTVRMGPGEEEPRMRTTNDELRAQIALLEARVADLEKRLAEVEKRGGKK